jgi:glycosyltransferase involved in cell wall biosynthesis
MIIGIRIVMRIGVDGSALRDNSTGIGNYVFYLLDELVTQRKSDHFFLYVPKMTQCVKHFSSMPNVTVRLNSFLNFSEALWSQTTLSYMAYKDNLEVFWGTTQSIPLFHRPSQKQILTVYDFAYRLYPKSVSFVRGFYLHTFASFFYKRAKAIISISKGTAERLKKHYGRAADAIVPPPIKANCGPKIDKQVFDQHRVAYKQYMLMVGTLEPRKNITGAIEAYRAILKKYPNESFYPLLIVGGKGWRDKKINQAIDSVKQDSIYLLGYVSDEELNVLMTGARFLLAPSIYEGYGMHLAEARCCQTEVISSDVPEMREAAEEECYVLSAQQFEEDLLKFMRQGKTEKSPPIKTKYISTSNLSLILSNTINSL